MATNTLQDGGVDNNWSTAGNWTLAHKPAGGEDIVMAINFNVTLDENSANLGSLDMTGYTGTLAMGSMDIDCAGNVTLDGTFTASGGSDLNVGGNLTLTGGMTFDTSLDINMDAGTGAITITTNGVTIGDLVINDGGGDATFTLADALVCNYLTITDGDVSTGGFDVTCNGDFEAYGGELVLGSSTVSANLIDIDGGAVTVNGADITTTDDSILLAGSLTALGDFSTDLNGNDFEVDGGTLDLGSATWTQTNGDTFTHTSGTVTCTSDNSARIKASGNTLSGITASNIINIIHGIDGGGNTKLNFLVSVRPPVGTMAMMGIGR